MMSGIVSRDSNVIIAQLKSDDHIKIRKEKDLTVIEESDNSLSGELIDILKFICNNLANYILVDNQFINLIRNEIRRSRIEAGMNSFTNELDDIAPYFKEDPELTAFSVLDGEDA
jgi:hypothetical protein